MPKYRDTGLRVKSNGAIYVNKKVFYSRPDVLEVIKELSESKATKEAEEYEYALKA